MKNYLKGNSMQVINRIKFSMVHFFESIIKVKIIMMVFARLLFFLVISFGIIALPAYRDKKNLSEVKNRFQKEVELIVKEYRFPGMTAAYVLEDGTINTFAAGFSDIEQKIPMSVNSRMLAASIGKTFTGAVILDLVREGKLNLDVPVNQYIGSENWFKQLANNNEITLRHLLTHSSGIENHVESPNFIKAIQTSKKGDLPYFKPIELVSFILNTPPLFKPGSGFHYSDTGYIIAGLVVEKITGKNLFGEIKSRLLVPLNLKNTEPSDKKELKGLASGYLSPENIFQLPVKTTIRPGLMSWNPGIEWAGGGFISTSKDLAVWGSTLYEGRALSGKYLKELFQGVTAAPGTKYSIATAITEDNKGDITYGHKGWIPGYCSSLLYYAKYKSVVAFQINTDIGIIGSDKDVLSIIETRLAKILFEVTAN
ncbi:MAG: beta-lactamase family protein [Spirochaetia bacterium]|nr:beta-lactamase family protein [Spirochaetia bacterium]